MERNENNGRGIFYGVIGVATLVVAIIGATFAYFSAAAGTNTPFNTAGASITLTWNETDYYQTNLIPVETGFKDGDAQAALDVDAAKTAFATSNYVGEAVCKDKNQNAICSMYQFTIGNPAESTANQQVYASITASVNTIQNLKYAIFEGTPQDIFKTTTKWNVNDTNGTGSLVVQARPMQTERLTWLDQVLDPGESHTYTVVMWIEEIGTVQPQGGSLTARIDFTTENNGQGVTGLLAA